MDFKGLKYVVVGSGFFGSVIAERIANDLNECVVVIEKRRHIGGNCFSKTDGETGIEYHEYGTHVFHTSNKAVWEYINNFTTFNGYRHQVLATYKNKVYQMPINLETINSFYNINLKPFEVDDFLKSKISKENILEPRNLEEKAISSVGRQLYEAFIKGYTIKQWQRDPKELPASIIDRLPVRKDYNESYFFDPWQGVPTGGYTQIFKNMLNHENIDLHLNVDFFDIKDKIPASCIVIYSGPLDRFFNYRFGKLEWRTLCFEKEIVDVGDYQGTSVMNYTEISIPFTRIHEPRHMHCERNYTNEKSLIIKEYPKLCIDDNPYYPINTIENEKVLKKYLEQKKKVKNVIFGGRLGDYKYHDIDATIHAALKVYCEKIKNSPSNQEHKKVESTSRKTF